jgi:CP family cyanate transporter-like MFS transporter
VVALWSRDAKAPDVVADAAPAVRGLYRDALAWQVTGFMGLQSLIYYTSVAWLPTLFVAEGLSSARAGFLLGIMNLVGVPVSLAVTLRAGARRAQTDLVLGTTALTAAGLIGVVVAPLTAPVLWMVLLGIGSGASISLALTLIGLRSSDARHAGQLSSMSQGIGYGIAAVGPVSLGIVHSLTGSWRTAFLVPVAALALMGLSGLGAGPRQTCRGETGVTVRPA